MLCTPKPNGFADHYPYLKWLFHWEYTLFSDKPIFHPEMVCPSGCCERKWNCNTTRKASGKLMENSLKKRCTWYLYCGLQVPESQAEMCADFQCFATSTKRAAVKFELFIDGSKFLFGMVNPPKWWKMRCTTMVLPGCVKIQPWVALSCCFWWWFMIFQASINNMTMGLLENGIWNRIPKILMVDRDCPIKCS